MMSRTSFINTREGLKLPLHFSTFCFNSIHLFILFILGLTNTQLNCMSEGEGSKNKTHMKHKAICSPLPQISTPPLFTASTTKTSHHTGQVCFHQKLATHAPGGSHFNSDSILAKRLPFRLGD